MRQSLRPEIGKGIDNSVMLVIKLTIASWACFNALVLHETESTSGGVLCIFGNLSCVHGQAWVLTGGAIPHSCVVDTM